MKLLFCAKCADLIKLKVGERRQCECGVTYGRYLEDGDNVEVSPRCIVVGVNNTSLLTAIHQRNERPTGINSPAVGFAAFVFPDDYRKIQRTT